MNSMTNSALTSCSAIELARMIGRGEVSSLEVVDAHIEQIERVNPALNAIVVERFDQARAEARDADRRRAGGDALGALHGVPITIKESLDVEGTPSSFGLPSRARLLAARDETHVARLRAAGAIVLGKSNVAQCLLYYESDNPLYGRANNPWQLARTPGGSSGGEGAAIAAGASPLGLGTDLGGSVRVPAAFCGIAGLKPTSGRTPDPGHYSVPIGQRAIVSQVGVLARRVADVALGLEIINEANVEPPLPLGDYRSVELPALRVAYYTDDGTLAVAPAVARAVREAAELLGNEGASVTEWEPPGVPDAEHLFFALLSGDGGRGLDRLLRNEPVDPRVGMLRRLAHLPAPVRNGARRLLAAAGQPRLAGFLRHFGYTHVSQHWELVQAQMDFAQHFEAALDSAAFDVILCPPCALPAYTHGAGLDLGLAGGYALLYNLLGYPAGVVPFTRVRAGEEVGRRRSRDRVERRAHEVETGSAGLPVGVQVVARRWREHVALAVMRRLEELAPSRPVTPTDAWLDPAATEVNDAGAG